MNTKNLLFYLALACFFISCSKDNKPPDLPPGYDVFLSGYSNGNAGYWKNGVFKNLGKHAGISGVYLDGTDVYTYGGKDSTEPGSGAGYWKNDRWVSLAYSSESFVYDLVVDSGNVYAVGGFGDGGRENPGYPAYWKNGAVKQLTSSYGFADHIVLHDGKVIISGGLSYPDNSNYTAVVWTDGVRKSYDSILSSSFYGMDFQGTDFYLLSWGDNGGVSGYYKNDIFHSAPDSVNFIGMKISGQDIYFTDERQDFTGYFRQGSYYKNGVSASPELADYYPAKLDVAGSDVYDVGSVIDTPVYRKNGIPTYLPGPGHLNGVAIRPKQ